MTRPPAPDRPADPTSGIPWPDLTPGQLRERTARLAELSAERAERRGDRATAEVQRGVLARILNEPASRDPGDHPPRTRTR